MLDGTAARYSVPADNPFVGATTFNGEAVAKANLRTEFWAVGMRNPWRFSIDPGTGELWCGNVGQDTYEGVYLLTSGANGGWSFYEQNHPGPRTPPAGFTYNHPIVEYAHGSKKNQGDCVVGGVVYRGTRFAGLPGTYIYGDYAVGNIWTLTRSGTSAPVSTMIGSDPGVSAFGIDPSNGDVLMTNYNTGAIDRIVILSSPDIISDAVPVGGGWNESGVMGYFYGVPPGWIYHQDQGWLYIPTGSTASSIWMDSQDMGWLWTSMTAYSFMYRSADGAWLWYEKDTKDPKWFYNLTAAKWEGH